MRPRCENLFLDEANRREFAVRNTFLQFGYLILGIRALGFGAGPMTGIDGDAHQRAAAARRL